jgi:hypothetical protein
MTRTRSGPVALLLGAFVFSVLAGPVLTGAPAPAEKKSAAKKSKKTKIPSPGKQLLQAYKNLRKTKSYSTTLTVEGGLSNTPDHKLFEFAVRESYDGKIYRQLMHVPAMKTFKTSKKGVRYTSGIWRNVYSDKDGKILQSFFEFPQDVLKQALRHAKNGKWIDTPKADESDGSEDADDESDVDTKKGGKGKTIVAKKGKKKSGKNVDVASMPRVLLITAPPKEALQHYIKVENSGCLGGG